MLSTAFERDDAGCAGFRQIDRSGGTRFRDGKRMHVAYGILVYRNFIMSTNTPFSKPVGSPALGHINMPEKNHY